MLLFATEGIQSAVNIVGYLALFVGFGLAFVFVNLLVGFFVRPSNPHPEKGEIYECGEPAIGSSYIQFDLRFYIVALLFIIFDVEVAFFFPWATVFGKSEHLAEMASSNQAVHAGQLTDNAKSLFTELGVRDLSNVVANNEAIAIASKTLAWITLVDIGIFFAILMLGFAYVWRRGDLDWVKAAIDERKRTRAPQLESEETS
ncbi:MAG TPA: NADH-quinone oxidoreductase subunit A [Planctomycetes bacterium]|nr:NADH-quinone oxidoreductase subunit A [Planctomycetota bacterium]